MFCINKKFTLSRVLVDIAEIISSRKHHLYTKEKFDLKQTLMDDQ